MLAEVECAETGGSKAAWITNFCRWLPTHPEIRTVIWEKIHQDSDWRVESSTSARNAFVAGMTSSLFN
jgi:hypothetical protein